MFGKMSASKVLLLGSGFVAKPTLDILANAGIQVTVGEFSFFLYGVFGGLFSVGGNWAGMDVDCGLLTHWWCNCSLQDPREGSGVCQGC